MRNLFSFISRHEDDLVLFFVLFFALASGLLFVAAFFASDPIYLICSFISVLITFKLGTI